MHCVVETEAFARQAAAVGLTEDQKLEIARLLSQEPTLGDLIPGAGGARKFRFAKAGMGKRGGYRIISYFAAEDVPLFLLDVLDKGERVNLTQDEKNKLKALLGRIAAEYRAAAKEKVKALAGKAS